MNTRAHTDAIPVIMLRREGRWAGPTSTDPSFEYGTAQLGDHLAGWVHPATVAAMTDGQDPRSFLGVILTNDEGARHAYLPGEAQKDLEAVAQELGNRTDEDVRAGDLNGISLPAAARALAYAADTLDSNLKLEPDWLDVFLPTARPDLIAEFLPGLPEDYVEQVRVRHAA